ncbi:MAG: heat-shock protein Hsp20 [Alphaproteobacteria bacterium]|nr:heat-shock protein Hsp20 [Alphaproteobacteria bacterium]|tara:strand:- start:21273 stop:21761 length:489 start_codon:yes stop_codon:yes gene_type:complete
MNTTGRLTLFDSPLFLGFDEFEKTFDRVRKSANEGYPPYNIEQIGEDGLLITLAVAGFSMDELDVEVEHNQLIIRGKQQDEGERIFLHRGIAARQFQRSFILADGIEVQGASLERGLLNIHLRRVVPESSARKIDITSKEEDKAKGKSKQKAIEGKADKVDD